MAQLDKTSRDAIGARLTDQLPGHWRVTVGSEGYAFIEIDQDGKKPKHKFHSVGSTVIVVDNGDDRMVEAKRYNRVPHPPGYLEGRKLQAVIARVNGRGWVDTLVSAILIAVGEADAALTAPRAAEA